VNKQGKWTCDGVPKNSDQEYNGGGEHPPYENDGTDCLMCGLPREAMIPTKTLPSPAPGATIGGVRSQKSPLLGIVAIAIILLLGGSGFWYLGSRIFGSETEEARTNGGKSSVILSETAVNSQLISQGEKVLFIGGKNERQKSTAAAAFASQNWEEAIREYQQAYNTDPNDPEAKIYLNNSQARKTGNPLTMAVVIPISQSVNEAKEVLRGVAQYQEEFNRGLPGRFLEVVIVDEAQSELAESLAQDLINSPVNVLGVMGHGVDNNSRLALELYELNNVAVLSSLNTAITTNNNRSVVKTIPLSQSSTLLGTYLKKVGETLADYAVQNRPGATVAVFYNSDSPYSLQLKQEFINAMASRNGQVVEEIDVIGGGFDADAAMNGAKIVGADVALLALSKNKVDTAIALAKANADGGDRLMLLGADELYNPTILQRGNNAIDGLVLAVPWQWNPQDTFATQAAAIWKGRVSWRTATSYDATQALAIAFNQHPGDRAAISQELNRGVNVNKSVTNFSLFNDIPLVRANPGNDAGFNYQFDPI